MFAHVHSTGRGYFAHAGNWLELVNKDTSGNVGLSGDLDVDGHTNLDNANVSGVVTFSISPNAIQMNDSARVSFGTSLKTSISYDASSSRTKIRNFNDTLEIGYRTTAVSYTHLTLPTIYSV